MNAFVFCAKGSKPQYSNTSTSTSMNRHFLSNFCVFCLFDCNNYFAERRSIASADYFGENFTRISSSNHPTDYVFSNLLLIKGPAGA